MCGRLGVWLARYLGVAKFEFWTFVASGIVGFFLFHCQHTFEGAMSKKPENWSFFENGMNSCSFLQIPWFFKCVWLPTPVCVLRRALELLPLSRVPL